MKTKILFLSLAFIVTLASCNKNEVTSKNTNNETLINDINVSKLNSEAKRYYGNMAKFISLTTPNFKSNQLSGSKSKSNDDSDSLPNPIVE